jgi:hypothetical protein
MKGFCWLSLAWLVMKAKVYGKKGIRRGKEFWRVTALLWGQWLVRS